MATRRLLTSSSLPQSSAQCGSTWLIEHCQDTSRSDGLWGICWAINLWSDSGLSATTSNDGSAFPSEPSRVPCLTKRIQSFIYDNMFSVPPTHVLVYAYTAWVCWALV